jgi:L,D-transpeptidase catalytic domain
MIKFSAASCFLAIATVFMLMQSCMSKKKETVLTNFKYEDFKDSIIRSSSDTVVEANNIFDDTTFLPGTDSLKGLLIKMEWIWIQESRLMENLDTLKKGLSKQPGFSTAEKLTIKENIRVVDSFLLSKDTLPITTCEEKECLVYIEINRAAQKLYLYLIGELKDSFLVSTGKAGKYETPLLSRRPAGPVLTKYTSRKFPGGNYMGLGNMPYAVFIQGGYAIHGTTTGNFSKLGTKASHGCIRLHPENAKIVNALVKTVGLQQTWVAIKDPGTTTE